MRQTTNSLSSLAPGFADPVHDTQTCFRAVLEAFSRPGLAVSLPEAVAGLPLLPGWNQPALAICLSLADQDSPLWLDESADSPEAREFLRFHCGSILESEPENSHFAIIGDPDKMPALQNFSQGTPSFPERSSFLIICVDDFIDGNGLRVSSKASDNLTVTAMDNPRANYGRCEMKESGVYLPKRQLFRLSGPGVRQCVDIQVSGLPAAFKSWWHTTQSAFPTGVDCLFTCGGAVLGLPRTSRLISEDLTCM